MNNDDGVTFANRDDAIPVLRLPSSDDDLSIGAADSGSRRGRRERLKEGASRRASRVRGKWEGYGSTTDGRQSLQDRLFASLLAQVIPSEGAEEGDEGAPPKKDRRSKKYVDKPEFGPRLMTYNFRRFNARIGVVFVLENRLIHLFSWRHPTATLSFLAIYSLLCLEPHLLPLVPLCILLFGIMIPSFLARHPAPANDPRIEPSLRGAPTAPASRVKPAPDFSNDFWRNMRDLQNSMEDFSRLHDAANEYLTPYTNFSDEPLSSTLFLCLSLLSCVAFVGSRLVPWRAIALITGWALTVAGHPRAQKVLLSTRNMSQLHQHIQLVQTTLRHWSDSDIVIDDPPEQRHVEIFELQRHHPSSDTWEPWLFSVTPYDPLSPARIAGIRPKGTQFFEDVQAPAGWVWKEKKWVLDLFSREWVEERMISGVEVETDGERWVYDIPAEEAEPFDMPPTKGKLSQRVQSIPKSGWEEGTGHERRGEWRRRRWTRFVERKVALGNAANSVH